MSVDTTGNSTTGMFVTVEGSEGAGKTTNLSFMRTWLEAAGKTVLDTREPGGTLLGEELRALLLGHQHDGMAEDTELLLMFAARAEHLNKVIRPALYAGHWVLCDRFTDATYAYQGGGRGVAASRISALEQWVQGDLRPDLTIYLDVPVALGMQRAAKRGAPDRFESERQEFFERVRHTYLARASEYPDRYRVVDASRSIEEVQTDVGEILRRALQA